MYAALLKVVIGGDDLDHLASMTGIRNVDDYPETMDHHEALVSRDAELRSSAMSEEFASI